MQGPALAVCTADGCVDNIPLRWKLDGDGRCADHTDDPGPKVTVESETDEAVYRDAFGDDYNRYVHTDT